MSACLTFALPIILHEIIALDERQAVAIGFMVSLITNFFLQRLYVFRNRTNLLQQAMLFLGFSVLWRLGEYWLFLVSLDQGLHYVTALIIILSSSTALKFALCKWVIFGQKQPEP